MLIRNTTFLIFMSTLIAFSACENNAVNQKNNSAAQISAENETPASQHAQTNQKESNQKEIPSSNFKEEKQKARERDVRQRPKSIEEMKSAKEQQAREEKMKLKEAEKLAEKEKMFQSEKKIASPKVKSQASPFMEALLKMKSRTGISLTNVQPPNGKEFKNYNGKLRYGFSGTVEMRGNLNVKAMNIFIYSNDKGAYDADKYLVNDKVPILKDAKYNVFKWQGEKNLDSGLYYYQFKTIDTGEIIYTGKFHVDCCN